MGSFSKKNDKQDYIVRKRSVEVSQSTNIDKPVVTKDENTRVRQCTNCHKETGLFFCPVCGQVIEYPSFVKGNESLCNHLERYVKDYVSQANNLRLESAEKVQKTKIADTIFKGYLEHIYYLWNLFQKKPVNKYFSKSGSTLFEDMSKFAERCSKNECEIAIVGTIKAGKSMFINAFLGKEIASTYPTPETATLTKFRYAPEGKNFVKVSFYNTEEWNKLWDDVIAASKRTARDNKESFLSEYNRLNADSVKDQYLAKEDIKFYPDTFEQLKEKVEIFTSSRYPDHYFVKEVEVGLSDFNVPKNVVFVDTPGLNDPVSFRSNITKKYLHSASVILLCVRSITAEFTSHELNDISELFSLARYSKERIFVLGTQFDIQSDYMNFWKTVRFPEMLKWLSDKEYFGSKDEAKKRILPVSAWFYNLIQRYRHDKNIIKDKKIKENWKKLIDSNLDYTEKTDLEEEFGEEEAARRYKTRDELFINNIDELERKTYIPTVRKTILEGPIKDSEQIILQDIKADYKSLCSLISEVANGVIRFKNEALKMYESDDIVENIKDLEDSINQKRAVFKDKKLIIDRTLEKLSKLSADKIKTIRK